MYRNVGSKHQCPDQKAVLRCGDQQAVFDDGAWSGIRPAIAVYDSVFVNENVFSGDVVTNEHLKKQYVSCLSRNWIFPRFE